MKNGCRRCIYFFHFSIRRCFIHSLALSLSLLFVTHSGVTEVWWNCNCITIRYANARCEWIVDSPSNGFESNLNWLMGLSDHRCWSFNHWVVLAQWMDITRLWVHLLSLLFGHLTKIKIEIPILVPLQFDIDSSFNLSAETRSDKCFFQFVIWRDKNNWKLFQCFRWPCVCSDSNVNIWKNGFISFQVSMQRIDGVQFSVCCEVSLCQLRDTFGAHRVY